MTPTVDDLIDTVRKLVGDIDSLEDKVKGLSRDLQDLNKTVELTKEVRINQMIAIFNFRIYFPKFHQELSILNNLSESQPRASLVSALQDEIKQIHHLEKENKELRIAIEQHQQVLEIVMSKYREQKSLLERINELESAYKLPKNDLTSQRYEYFQEKVNEMVLVMDTACQVNDDKIERNQHNISKITEENNRIRKLLLYK